MKIQESKCNIMLTICAPAWYNKDIGNRTLKGALTMNELVNMAGAELTAQQTVSADLFQRWIAYIDASPKTIATYTRSIKRFFLYLQVPLRKRSFFFGSAPHNFSVPGFWA